MEARVHMSAEGSKKQMRFPDFLESTPPYTLEAIAGLFDEKNMLTSGTRYRLSDIDIQLHCENESCQGVRFFEVIGERVWIYGEERHHRFISYVCRNCRKSLKTYALVVKHSADMTGEATKFGELPYFGTPTPSRVITLIGPDRDLFLRGRRAENSGFGIGSFAYYRRVVENQKSHIIQEIAKASAKLGASPEMLADLRRAASETQFSKAIDGVKAGIPAALLIDGHNPLTLLHTALSEGLHDHTDEECMEIALEIRLVLTELAERISQALKEEAALTKAVSRLMNRKKRVPEVASKEQILEAESHQAKGKF